MQQIGLFDTIFATTKMRKFGLFSTLFSQRQNWENRVLLSPRFKVTFFATTKLRRLTKNFEGTKIECPESAKCINRWWLPIAPFLIKCGIVLLLDWKMIKRPFELGNLNHLAGLQMHLRRLYVTEKQFSGTFAQTDGFSRCFFVPSILDPVP